MFLSMVIVIFKIHIQSMPTKTPSMPSQSNVNVLKLIICQFDSSILIYTPQGNFWEQICALFGEPFTGKKGGGIQKDKYKVCMEWRLEMPELVKLQTLLITIVQFSLFSVPNTLNFLCSCRPHQGKRLIQI